MDIGELIERIKPFQPKKIILFGSRAYGTAGMESDFDIAIIKNTSQLFHDRLIDVRRLVRTTTPIDFFVFTEQEIESKRQHNPFIAEIVSRGKVVYEQ